MNFTECPHCNGSLDVEQCDECSEFFPTGEVYEFSNGQSLCIGCQENFFERTDHC